MWISHFSKSKNQKGKAKLSIKLKRVPIQIVVTGHESIMIQGHLLLNDLTHKGFAVYTAIKMTEGQEVILKIMEPRPLECKGTVIFCLENLSDSHIVSQNVFTQRVGVIMKFENEEAQKKYLETLKVLETHYMGISDELPGSPALAVVPPPAAEAPAAPVASDPAVAVAPAAADPAADGGALPQAA